MKKLLFVFILLVNFSVQSKAQTYVLIPDANFANYLQLNMPAAMSGNSLNITHTIVTTGCQVLQVIGLGISNLYGVQYFTSLTSLNCTSNSLTSLPTLPNSISKLICADNSLTNLPTLPNSTATLDCRFNNLTSLPTLPNSLTSLDCRYNNLTSLPALPNSLIYLLCTKNYLTILPTLPNSLSTIYCGNNSLASLPALPNLLGTLYCNSNSLTVLPTLPGTLYNFRCDSNYLTSLPALENTNLGFLNCAHNNIVCFPVFPNLIFSIFLSPNPFTCLPNYVLPAMNGYTNTPLCVAGNTAGCTVAGIKEFKSDNSQISIYPNPSSSILYFKSTSGSSFDGYTVIDFLGRKVLEQKERTNQIDIKSLEMGMYQVILSTEGKTYSSKFIKE